ncbi:MAG: fibrobacter succinogenes major paralogous domain-containing protein [Bacteroidales bacterium]|nr:fibrobacter succinogenes major paralogous domain-containing protein [Bacteroidales bacterium]
MKNITKHIFSLAALCVWAFVPAVAQQSQITVNTTYGNVSYNSVVVDGSLVGAAIDEVNDYLGFVYSSNQVDVYRATASSLGTGIEKLKDGVSGLTWNATISGLDPSQKYYVRAVYGVPSAGGGIQRYYLGGVASFTTESVAPSVGDANPVGLFSATLNATLPRVVADAEYYFIYSDSYPTVNNISSTSMPGFQLTASVAGSAISAGVDGLESDKTYYFRPVCGLLQPDNTMKYYYGDIKSFRVGQVSPVTNLATNVGYFDAKLNGSVLPVAEAESGYMGFVYSATSSSPTCEDGSSTITYGSTNVAAGGDFSENLTGLDENQTYHYRAYVYLSVPGVGSKYYYGAVKTFTTSSYSVRTTSASTSGYFSVSATGTVPDITSLGSNVECGFAYSSTQTSPTEADNVVYAASPSTSFSANLVDLEAGVTCYYRAIVRAYVNGQYVYYYGNVRSIATAPITVTTLESSEIGYYKATLAGRVSGDRNGYTYGVIYSATAGVSATNGKIIECDNASVDGEYSKDVTKLSWGTKYFYVAYARQPLSNGQYRYYYGLEKQFSTKGSNPNPVTLPASSVLTDGATLCGVMSTESIDLGTTTLGFIYSATNSNPVFGDVASTSAPYEVQEGFDGSYSVAVSGLESSTKYYYRAYAQVTIEETTTTYYGDALYVTTGNASMVDLGLSVRWANCNVGASSPEEFGSYFAWGETSTKTTYDWSSYVLCAGSDTTITKYCTDVYYGNGTKDGLTTLSTANDVATIVKGSMWRMPTKEEINELITICTWTWTQKNDVYGYEVKGPSGNSIFLPAAGYMIDGNVRYQGSYGHYWSNTLGDVSSSSAYAIFFSATQRQMTTDNNSSYLRCQGFSVRAVAP